MIVGTTTRAESGASVSFTFDTMDLKMMPMRENLMPPAVEPEAPPTMNARVRKAPLLESGGDLVGGDHLKAVW